MLLNIKLSVTDAEWSEIFDKEKSKFITSTYVDFFAKKINSFGISCVLAASKQKVRRGCSLTFYCLHSKCECLYKLKAKCLFAEFEMFTCGEQKHNKKYGVARPLSGKSRILAEQKIATVTPMEFYKESCDNADKQLVAEGNLQDCRSIDVFNVLKSQAYAAGDFDKNHITDLTKMKKKNKRRTCKTRSKVQSSIFSGFLRIHFSSLAFRTDSCKF